MSAICRPPGASRRRYGDATHAGPNGSSGHMASMTFARRLAHVENIPQQDSAELAKRDRAADSANVFSPSRLRRRLLEQVACQARPVRDRLGENMVPVNL